MIFHNITLGISNLKPTAFEEKEYQIKIRFSGTRVVTVAAQNLENARFQAKELVIETLQGSDIKVEAYPRPTRAQRID
jgi:diketogulonate reductase-like aldo/keto reductase|tara:strand:- start:559 stop:792 length:234 start_codon:yes stop_codon:yes gene_type:complete